MSRIEKLRKKFYKIPVPNDITFREAETFMTHHGCKVISGGKHSKIVHKESNTIIPVPRHGKYIEESYVRQIKKLYEYIMEGEHHG
jgi:hypothetical protein